MKNLKLNIGKKFNRRQFLKASGLASAALGTTGLGFYGYEAGKNPESYSGWENFEGANQTFNRKRRSVDRPTYEKVGSSQRPDARTEVIFQRRSLFMRQWKDDTGLEGMDDYLQEYYRKKPEDLELDIYSMKELMPKLMSDSRKYRQQFILANARSNAMGAVSPRPINEPPEKSDFPSRRKPSSLRA